MQSFVIHDTDAVLSYIPQTHQTEDYNAKSLTQHVIDVPANTNRIVIDQSVHIVAVKQTHHTYKIKLATIISVS